MHIDHFDDLLAMARSQTTLERLVAGVQAGDIGPCLPFDRAGVPLQMA